MIIFFGKNGSNAINLLNRGFDIEAGFTNEPESKAIPYFKEKGIDVVIIDDLKEQLKRYEPELIVLAGFMRILPEEITSSYRIINIHPSLLPYYKGLNAMRRSYGDKLHTGITIHFVNEKLDEGEIIKQIPVDPQCTYEEFQSRMKEAEHEYLPQVIKELL